MIRKFWRRFVRFVKREIKMIIATAVIVAAIFMPKYHLRTMEVVYIDHHAFCDYVSVVDCDGEAFGFWVEDPERGTLERGDDVFCLTLGEGKKTQILDYVK